MKRISIIVFLVLTALGCSAQVIEQKNEGITEDNAHISSKKIAEGKFIDGSILETKGQYQAAVNEFLEAAKYDPQPGIFYSIAKNYYRLNKLSQAVNYSKKSVAGDSTNIDYLDLLATIYSSSQLIDSSINVYEKIIKLDSTDASVYFQLAQLYEHNRPSHAIELYKKVIDLVGPEWSVLVRLIDLNERMGNVQETIKTVEELIKLNPSDLHLQKALIESYIKTKEFDKAIKLLNEALISFPDDLSLTELKGNIFLQQGNWKDAYNEYIRLIKSDTLSFEDKLKVGSLFLSAAEKDSSSLGLVFNIFQEISKDSSDWQVNAYLGEIKLRERDDSAAIDYFKKAASLAEWNSQLWVRLGGILYDNRKYSEAVTFMDKAVEKFPNDFTINLIYGLSLSQDNQNEKAKVYLQRALNINPDDLTTLSALGYSLNQLKENDEAIRLLQKALAIQPDNVQIIGQLALIYDSKKNFKMSDSLYYHALSVDSTNTLILNNFAYSLSERGIKLEEALKMSKRAVEAEPKNSSFLDTIGWIYYMMGDYNKAKKFVEESLALDSKSATVNDHLGDIFFRLGDKARVNWKKASDLEPDNENFRKKVEKGVL